MTTQHEQAHQLLLKIIQQGFHRQRLPIATLIELASRSAEFTNVWLAHALASSASDKEIALALHFASEHDLEGLKLLEQFWQHEIATQDNNERFRTTLAEFAITVNSRATSLWKALTEPTRLLTSEQSLNADLRQTQLALPELSLRYLIDHTHRQLEDALLYGDKNEQQILTDVRNNKQFISEVPATDLVVASLTRLMAAAQQQPVSHSEPLIFYRYQQGEEFKWHHDYIVSDAPAVQDEIAVFGQRVKTSVLYLNDEFSGGATRFKHWKQEVKPPTGGMVTFNNTNEAGLPIPASLHCGSPVESGEKWVATLWSRQKPHWLRRGLLD
ncbi:hypothetical protein CWE12_06740 [Aliidiomarina sedimenti]|uniref:Fe2OG dioxygenase domain-containing protein n=1 Tax=Aliidiomarina sedimenti TaxID=1933879 RepID=A0ABY0C136_9GAMM|nr:2OG-Fe(II) oxygenase [Aliidiomarina sedimenti]RUO30929.1 hypothetical protein CWE12_06740 [Aliidiomarina sedimenti]